MPIFEYEAQTKDGAAVTGSIEAAGEREVVKMLGEMGLEINSIQQQIERPRGRIGHDEFVFFNTQLANLVQAGLPIEQGLQQLAQDLHHPALRRIVTQIGADLQKGVSLEEAVAKHEDRLPMLYSRIIRAGVQSGQLAPMLVGLNRHLQLTGQTRRLIWEALSYPLVVLAFAAVLFSAVIVFVVPQFEEIYIDFDTYLPSSTELMIALAHHIWQLWLIVAAGVAAILLLLWILGKSHYGRRLKEHLFMKIPVVGRLYRCSLLSRLAEALAVLVSAGTGMPEALRLSAQATGSPNLTREGDMLSEQLERGQPLTESIVPGHLIGKLFGYTIEVAAQRSDLAPALHRLSQMYEQETHHLQSGIRNLLLPVAIIVVGAILCFAVMAMFLPLVHLIQSVSGG